MRTFLGADDAQPVGCVEIAWLGVEYGAEELGGLVQK